jgi:hypothetical protein
MIMSASRNAHENNALFLKNSLDAASQARRRTNYEVSCGVDDCCHGPGLVVDATLQRGRRTAACRRFIVVTTVL